MNESRRFALRKLLGASLASLLAAAGGIVAAAAPAAAADSIAVDDTYAKVLTAPTIVVAAPGVLGNDQVRSGAIAMLATPAAANGTVSLGDSGGFTYTPGSGFAGTDSFGYCIGDGVECDSSAANGLVSIVQPVATADTYSTRVNQALTVADPGVLGNDQNLPMGAKVTLPTSVGSGTLDLSQTGGFTYAPASDAQGQVSFTYCVGDGFDGCYSDAVSVTITIASPTAVNDTYDVQHDRVLTVPDPGVMGNDVNVPSDGRITQPGGVVSGILTPNSSKAGGFTYTPNAGFAGSDSFSYCVGDGFDGCFTDFATATINVVAGPAPPSNVAVHPGNNVVAVEFTATPDTSVTGYTATCKQDTGGDAGVVTTTASETESPISVFGVLNGVLASCTVHATSPAGDGFETQILTTTPLVSANPGVPTNLVGTALPGQLRLSFATPTSDGGARIYRYAVDCFISTGSASIGIARVFTNASPVVVDVPFDIPGFPPDNGLLVSCRLVAFNANGGSGFSETSAPVLVFPADVPGAPTGASASAGNARVTVSFTPPSDVGGSSITSYVVTCSDPGGNDFSAQGTASPIVVTGLTNGVPVRCGVRAFNANGGGPPSVKSNSVIPGATAGATVPGAPRHASAAPGNGQATVTFSKPLSNGGSGILDYTATCGTKSTTGTGSPLVVSGLTNGALVNCTVTARNAVGTSAPSSPPVPVRPATVPGAPRSVTATPGNAQATVKFSKPLSNGGSGITGYTATCGSKSRSGAGSPLVVTGLANGITVNCTVRASNAIGAGPASSPPVAVKPRP